MSDYKSRFEKWQKDAKEKFEEVDRQLGIKEKITEGARAVGETAQKGAQKIKTEAEKSEVAKQAVRAAETDALVRTLQCTRGNRSAAARVLGVSRQTLYNKLKSLGIEP